MELEFRNKLRDAAYDDLTAYAEYVNPEEPPAHHHIFLCDKLMASERGENPRMLVSMPPGAAKSTYCSRLFPSWYLGRNPTKKFIQAGHTQNFVESEFGKKTRDIIASEEYSHIFPEIGISTDSRSAGRWGLSNRKGGYIAKGIGQAIAGFRGNIAVVDDPIGSRADAESQTVRDEVYNWFSADLTTRLLPHSPMFVVATRWHSDDLCGRLEDATREGKQHWEIINIPALCESDEGDPIGRREGEWIWPEFYPISHFLTIRSSIPGRDWNSLYMGVPTDASSDLLDSQWFKRYTGDPRKLETPRKIVVSVDTANKANERNDYTAILVWIEGVSGNNYLADVVREKMEFPQMVKKVEDTAKRWKANAILMEDKGSGTQYIQTRQGKAPAPVIAIPVNSQSKEFRFDAVTPMIEAGEVFLPETASWLPDYEREILAFPLGKNDDQVDATSQYLAWVRGRKNKGRTAKIQTQHGVSMDARRRMVENALAKEMERLAQIRMQNHPSGDEDHHE